MRNKVFGVLLAMFLVLSAVSVPVSAREVSGAEEASPVQWTVSKSKTAGELKDFMSEVTLSLPAADEKPSVDVVIVMDVSSSMKDLDIAEAKKAALSVCDELAAKNNVDTHIGIVTFDRIAHDLTGGLVTAGEAKTAIEKIEASSDTNMMAGLIAGKAMLDSGSASDKYMVIMSDGIPIYWMENGEPMSKTAHHFRTVDESGFPVSETSFPAGTDPEASNNDLSAVMSMEEILAITDWDTDADDWYANSNTGETFDNGYKYTNIQKSTYYTAKYLQDEIFGRYPVKMVAFGTDKYKNNAVYQYGENFCDWIGAQPGVSYYKVSKPNYGGEEGDLVAAFDEIANELICLLDAGSSVVDFIGDGKDNGGNDYNFDFINDLSALKLTVGGVELEKETVAENTFGFGKRDKGYDFTLTYVPGSGTEEEHLIWDINVPVTIDQPVQLTYSVLLTNPQSDIGIYGTYDRDGSQGYDGLYTNNRAVLYPVDSRGNRGKAEEFPKPTVSYQIPQLNKEDHIAYIIGRPGDLVCPEENITRAEVATVYFRLLDDQSRRVLWSKTNDYTDVEKKDWYNNAVSTMTEAKILFGYEDGTFGPDQPITRAEMAAIAARFDRFNNEPEIEDPPTFNDVAGHWAEKDIEKAAAVGWLKGYEDGSFRPDQYITRAEAMSLINRVLFREVELTGMLPDMKKWPDNSDPKAWYYTAVQEATNSHEYKRTEKQVEGQTFNYEVWTVMLPNPDWEALEKTWSEATDMK